MRTEEKEKRDKDPERGDEERERRYRERKVRGQAGGVLGICRVEAIHALLVGAFLKSVVTQDSKSEEILSHFPYMLFSFQEKYMVILGYLENMNK